MLSQTPPVLFLDKLLLDSREADKARGVHVFNRNLLIDLSKSGVKLFIPCTRAWAKSLKLDIEFTPIFVPELRSTFFAALISLYRAPRAKLVLANSVSSLALASTVYLYLRSLGKGVVIAHKRASNVFFKLMPKRKLHVVGVNSVISEDFKVKGFSFVDTYYGVTDWESFQEKQHISKNITNFCVVGDLDNDWKGADTAIEAFKLLNCSNAKLHLMAFSEIPENLDPNMIQCHSRISPEKMPDFLAKMDVMIVPSRDKDIMKETFSQCMVQGMLSGLPIISSSLPVLVEKIPDGKGGLVFNDTKELALHVERLSSDVALRASLGRQARHTALTKYCWNTNYFLGKFVN